MEKKEKVITILENVINDIKGSKNFDLHTALDKIINHFSEQEKPFTDVCLDEIVEKFEEKFDDISEIKMDTFDLVHTLMDEPLANGCYNMCTVDSEIQNLLFSYQGDDLYNSVLDDLEENSEIWLESPDKINLELVFTGVSILIREVAQDYGLDEYNFTKEEFAKALEEHLGKTLNIDYDREAFEIDDEY